LVHVPFPGEIIGNNENGCGFFGKLAVSKPLAKIGQTLHESQNKVQNLLRSC
jgi:hypothetical protein